MIEALKSDRLVRKVGGAFRLTALVQRRLKELVEGARPMVESRGKTLVEVAVNEIDQGKLDIDYERSPGLAPPAEQDVRDEMHGHS